MGRAFVVDASALLDVLVAQAPFGTFPDMDSARLNAPTLLDYEFVAGARRLHHISPGTARRVEAAIPAFSALTIERHEAGPLLPRIWSLRDSITSYDASYVALAEALDIPLITSDLRLARAAAPYCEVITPR